MDFQNDEKRVRRINCTLEIPENYEVFITEFSSKLVQPDNFVLLGGEQISEHRIRTISQTNEDVFAGMESLENLKNERRYEDKGGQFLEVFTTNSKLSLLFRNSKPNLAAAESTKVVMISEFQDDRNRIRKVAIEKQIQNYQS